MEPLIINVLEGFGLDGNRFLMRLQPSTKDQTTPVFLSLMPKFFEKLKQSAVK